MLFFYSGIDRDAARKAMNAAALAAAGKKGILVRITDANPLADLSAGLQGAGMFGTKRAVVLDGVLANEEMRATVLGSLTLLKESAEDFFLYEEKPDSQTRRTIEKYAKKTERFDAAKGKREGGGIFALANALKRADKKALWIEYQRALLRDDAPEAIHGVLFWGAKDMFLSAKKDPERGRGARLVAELAELPHAARRRGFELEYALEEYILGINKM